eukprot:g11041.t2
MTQTDRDALLALHHATDGPCWKNDRNWNTDAALSDWYGVAADDQDSVMTLRLLESNLKGHIPPELGALSELRQLALFKNKLTGPIPLELGNLTALKGLSLAGNQLSGHIPPQLGDLGALLYLDLSGNKLDGPIPPELGKLTALQDLSLWTNQLSGRIPPELGALSELRVLGLGRNELTGHIPPEIGALSELRELDLESNELTGVIPEELGKLTALEGLQLGNNNFSALWDHTQDMHGVDREDGTTSESGGPVPSQLCRLLDVLDGARLNLENNPWAEPPESIVTKGSKHIRRYFEDLFSEPCRIQRNSVKVVLVGQEGAGKTSLCRSMKANKADPTGEWKVNSTVFADVEPMVLEGASVRVYDCAGQVAYTGLLQMFLTPRSVCVLVCDAEAFACTGNETDGQMERDIGKLEELRVCDWLRSISLRVPGDDVILVATKCDLVGGNPREIGRRIGEACRTWLASWVAADMQPVKVEDSVSLTSCRASEVDGSGQGESSSERRALERGWECDWPGNIADENDSPSLIHRVVHESDGFSLRGAQMVLPRSWDIALAVLEALEHGRDPVEMTLRKLANPDKGEAAELAERKRGAYQGITLEELNAKWLETVQELANKDVSIINPEHALEGALSIREFEGSLIRHETYVFLDVVWLTRILKPLLNHKDKETFDGRVRLGDTGDACVTLDDHSDIVSWGRLKNEGILEPRLAHAIWPVGLSQYVLPTLQSLGLTFPLENDPAKGLVVLLRLKPDRPARVGEAIDVFRSKYTPAFNARWKFFLGVPPGAIEKVLTWCCSIGGVQTFWRFGVLVRGGFGGQDDSRIFAVVVEYSSNSNELTAEVYGDVGNPAPWAALSYVISAVRSVLLEFPGLRSRSFLRCPRHGDDMPLASTVTGAGDRLLLDGAGCPQCSPETRGLGAAAVELLRMVDIRIGRGALFAGVEARFRGLEGRYTFSDTSTCSEGKTNSQALVQLTDAVKEGFDGQRKMAQELKGSVDKTSSEAKTDSQALVQLTDAVKEGFDEQRKMAQDLKGSVDKVAKGVQESIVRIKNLQAREYPYPHLVVVREIATQRKEGLMAKVCSMICGIAQKEMTLHFLCPVDMDKVPCGVDGEGYRFRETRGWVKKISPVLQVAMVTAKVALKAWTGLELDTSQFLQDVSNGLVEEIADRILDEEALSRVLSGEENAGAHMQEHTKTSYEALKEFMEKEELNRQKNAEDGDGYIDFREKMTHTCSERKTDSQALVQLTDAVKEGFDEQRKMAQDLKGSVDKTSSEAKTDSQALVQLTDAVKEGFDEQRKMAQDLKGSVDKVAKGVQESIVRIKNLQAREYPYPHLVVVREIATQRKEGLMAKVCSMICGIAQKEMTLHFLCPVDMDKVPCGVDGEGYRFRETRGWVKKISPVLQDVSNGLVEEIADRILDEEALSRVLSGEENAGAHMQEHTKTSYEALKEFMEKEELNRQKNAEDGDGYIDFREKMTHLARFEIRF